MNEKIIVKKKNAMLVLIITTLLLAASFGAVIGGGILMDEAEYAIGVPVFVVGLVWACIGWIPYLGLKVIKPQEALVLTLFGKYVGTLKEDGFYYVNPFCVAVNPAAKTKLSQSGDVDGQEQKRIQV